MHGERFIPTHLVDRWWNPVHHDDGVELEGPHLCFHMRSCYGNQAAGKWLPLCCGSTAESGRLATQEC